MAYGERKARKPLEDFGVLDKFGLGLASAGGIAVATFIDLTQSDEGSALFVFNKWLVQVTGMLGLPGLPLYSVVLILMAIGGLSVLFLQPVTLKGAFAQGFGVLAAIMTIAPSDLGAPLPGTLDDLQDLPVFEDLPPAGDGSATLDSGISYTPTSAAELLTPVAMVQTSTAVEGGYSVRIKITFENGLRDDVRNMIAKGRLRGRLYNEATGVAYNLFRSSGGDVDFRGNTLYLSTRLPGEAPTTTLVARLEAEGYCIKEERFDAKKGANPIWEIAMDPGCGPLMLQRLNRPYKF